MPKNFQGGTYEEQRNDPVNQLIASGTYKDIPRDVVDNYFNARASQEETIARIKGTPVFNASAGPQINFEQGTAPTLAPTTVTPRIFDFLGRFGKGNASSSDVVGAIGGNKASPDVVRNILASPLNPQSVPTSSGSKIGSSLTPDSANLPFPNVGTPPIPPDGGTEMNLDKRYGVDALTTQIGNIDQQITALIEKKNAEIAAIQSQPVSTRVMSKEAKMASAAISAELQGLRNQRINFTRQLTQATKSVGMIMRANALDYANAERVYKLEVSQNEKAQSLFDKEENKQFSRDKGELTVMMNHAETMTPDEKSIFDNLGMRVYGSDWAHISPLMHLRVKAVKDTVYHDIKTDSVTGARTFETITRSSDGHISYNQTPISGKETTIAVENNIITALHNERGSDGYVSPADYAAAKESYVRNTGKTGTDFDNKAEIYRNPKQSGYNLNPTASSGTTYTPPKN